MEHLPKDDFEVLAQAMAAFETDRIRILALLDDSSADPNSSVESRIRRLQSIRCDELKRQYEYTLNAHIPWWSILEHPFHAVTFMRRRTQLAIEACTAASLAELDAMLAQIEFGVEVPCADRTNLRRSIAMGTFTPREARRLTRSQGCRIDGERLLPNPSSMVVTRLGGAATITLSSFGLLCLAYFINLIATQCNSPPCVALGSLMLFVIMSMLECLCTTTTWGRTSASKALEALLEMRRDSSHRPYQRTRFQWLRSLAW